MPNRWEWGKTWGIFMVIAALLLGAVSLVIPATQPASQQMPQFPIIPDREALQADPVGTLAGLLSAAWNRSPGAVIGLGLIGAFMGIAFCTGLVLWGYLLFRRLAYGPSAPRMSLTERKIDLSGRIACVSGRPPVWGAVESFRLLSIWYLTLVFLAMSAGIVTNLLKLEPSLAVQGTCSVLAGICGVILIVRLLDGRARNAIAALGWNRSHLASNLLKGVAGYAMALPMMMVIGAVWATFLDLFGLSPALQETVEAALYTTSNSELLFFVAVAVIAAPLIEESLFRGFLFPPLRARLGVFGACLVSGGIFAFAHQGLTSLLPILSLGALLAYLYERTGSLAAPAVTHALNNGLSLAAVLCLRALAG